MKALDKKWKVVSGKGERSAQQGGNEPLEF